jgi:sugar phosphate isomerase/epimerase
MRLSLSTNWFTGRSEDGAEIADKAVELGFMELELGYRATEELAESLRGRIAVGSVHAFCPAPLSAPSAHPELYPLASFDREAASLARLQVLRTAEFASGIGASTVVLHAGRVSFRGLFQRLDTPALLKKLAGCGGDPTHPSYMRMMSRARKLRESRGAKLLDSFKSLLAGLIPDLERFAVTLALENLPYFEGFPNERETENLLAEFSGAPIAAWFDTGHHHVRRTCGWLSLNRSRLPPGSIRGMHLNDVNGTEDGHLSPGCGKVDFAALKDMARSAEHVVFEPSSAVSEEELAEGVAYIRKIWGENDIISI